MAPEPFFRHDDYGALKLSPSGKYIGALVPVQGRLRLAVIDLDTAKPLATSKRGSATLVRLEVPIVDDRQSAHLKVTGTLQDPGYTIVNGTLTFDRAVSK